MLFERPLVLSATNVFASDGAEYGLGLTIHLRLDSDKLNQARHRNQKQCPRSGSHAAENPSRGWTSWQAQRPMSNRALRDIYPVGSMRYTFFDDVHGKGNKACWSEYATELYTGPLVHGKTHGWAEKLQYVLYEDLVQAQHAHAYLCLQVVLI